MTFNWRDRKLRGKVNCKMTKFGINSVKQLKLSVELNIQSYSLKKGKENIP